MAISEKAKKQPAKVITELGCSKPVWHARSSSAKARHRSSRLTPLSEEKLLQIQGRVTDMVNHNEALRDEFQSLCAQQLAVMARILIEAAKKGDASCAKFIIEHGAGRAKESKDVHITGVNLINDVFEDEDEAGNPNDQAIGQV